MWPAERGVLAVPRQEVASPLDGNGAAEVVYGDENYLWVYDGATGAVLLQDATRGSGTVNEYPTIVDVDADGNAEIVVGSNTSGYGVYVLGDAADEWISARPVWNQQAYYITNVDDDLGIPAPAMGNWPTYNNFRQGSPGNTIAQAATNLYPVPYDVCQEACGDDVDLWVQVANDGLVLADSTLVLAVYGVTSTGATALLDDTELGLDLDPGDLTAAYGFTFTTAELAPYAALAVVADDLGASSECDETDNQVLVSLIAVCP